MKVAFTSEHAESDTAAFSGITHRMAEAIRVASDSFSFIQVPSQDWGELGRDDSDWRRKTEYIGQYLSARLRQVDADVLICSGSMMVPFLQTDIPIVIWHDSTWHTHARMCFEEFRASYPFLYECDCRILEKSQRVVFAADWVREETLAHYKVDCDKVDVIPFGANMDPPAPEVLEESIRQRENVPCYLTFLGKQWIRKGLPLAFDVMEELNRRGIPTRLGVIGCDVPAIGRIRNLMHSTNYRPFTDLEKFQRRFHNNVNVDKIGFLDKRDPRQYRLLYQILRQTHFLLHPAVFECFGIVVAEANAFGVPVLAPNNHGPRTSIRDGMNGYLFQRCEYVECAVAVIERLMSDAEAYRSLALSSSAEYYDRLNWTVNVKRLMDLISS